MLPVLPPTRLPPSVVCEKCANSAKLSPTQSKQTKNSGPGCQSGATAVRGPLLRKLGIHESVLALVEVAFRLKTINS